MISKCRRQKYFNLKQSVVIFICTFDPFADDRSIYTFETTCKENKGLVLADKRRTYFVNVNGNREGISEDTTKLLDYFHGHGNGEVVWIIRLYISLLVVGIFILIM